MNRPKILITILLAMIIFALVGCSGQTIPIQTEQDAVSNILASDTATATPELTDESEPLTSAAEDSEETASTDAKTEEPAEKEKEPDTPATSADIPKAETNPTVTESPQKETEKPAETPKPPETPKQTEAPKTTEQPKPAEQPTVKEEPTPTEPSVTEKDEPSEPPKQDEKQPSNEYTQADYDQIIAEVTAYAESYKAKGFTFEWKEDMEFGWEVGYFGTPRIKYEGVDGTIELLKLHVDRIYRTGTDAAYGATSNTVTYKVVQITVDGDIAFAVIYGG